jgi:hypothetical protein
LVDPSANDIQTLTSKIEQTALSVSQNWYAAFDNVSYMNEETSDLLCRASTGGSFSKRILYTDEETVIQKLSCCVSINGINVVISKPDLMDRCILVKYGRISQSRRKEEKDILDEFEEIKGVILGGIFDVLARAIRTKPYQPDYDIPRMADFTKWGISIAEAIGYEATTFLSMYNENIAEQNREIINSHPIGVALLDLMKGLEEWEGSPSELLANLEARREDLGIDKRSKGWPKAPHVLSKKLGELETTLVSLGYKILFDRSATQRAVRVIKEDDADYDACPF